MMKLQKSIKFKLPSEYVSILFNIYCTDLQCTVTVLYMKVDAFSGTKKRIGQLITDPAGSGTPDFIHTFMFLSLRFLNSLAIPLHQ
jgi:hypothetical protein